MGGDVVAGTNLVDALKVFENDPDTEGIIVVGEIGGRAENDAAEWIKDYHRRVKTPKSVSPPPRMFCDLAANIAAIGRSLPWLGAEKHRLAASWDTQVLGQARVKLLRKRSTKLLLMLE